MITDDGEAVVSLLQGLYGDRDAAAGAGAVTVALDLEQYHHRVYFAARDGLSLTLYVLLNEVTDTRDLAVLLNESVEADGVCCTPLVAAARNGHVGVVKLLLEKFREVLDLETETTVRFDGCSITGATALWVAAGSGHLNVVKMLVQAGAQLDHPTSTSSTPLRAACFEGRLDIVRYLVSRGADLHLPNHYNNTCLIIASYKGHLDIVTYLLNEGAKIDEQARCGGTALHFAAECGHVAVVEELLARGAALLKNADGMTALMCAAEATRSEVVELIVERPEVTREEAVTAIELLGASFANDKDYYCPELAYKYMHRSMEMRLGNATRPPLPKRPMPPIPAYDNWKECESLEELANVRHDPSALHMEGLTVRERILGRGCKELPHPIVFRGAVCADNDQFDRCLALWEHALELLQENNVPVVKDLLRFAQLFSQMIYIGNELSIDQVVRVLYACSLELRRVREKLEKKTGEDDRETHVKEYESNMKTALYLVTIAAQLLKHKRHTVPDPHKVMAAVYHLNSNSKYTDNRQTLLHLALNQAMPVDEFHTDTVCKFPCPLTCKLLLECGADPNALDSDRNSPLHYAARTITNQNSNRGDAMEMIGTHIDSEQLETILIDLLKYGAHIDIVNDNGQTPADIAGSASADFLLRCSRKNKLSCLAAKVICAHRIRFEDTIPNHLHSFVRLHGRCY